MRIQTVIKRIVLYFLLVMFAFLLQTCLFPLLGFLAAVPNLILIITFSYGFIYGTMTGLVCGLFAGFLMDIFYSQPFGFFILVYCYLGFFSGLFSDEYRNDSMILPVVLCLACEAFYNFAMLAYRVLSLGFTNIRFVLRSMVLPEAFFTLLVTIAVYHVLLGMNRRLDTIDDLRGQNAA